MAADEQNNTSKPLYFLPDDDHIIMETFSPNAEQAQDFLIAISEPVSRGKNLHEYKLTKYSLHGAISGRLQAETIISVLAGLSKVPVPESIVNFIRQCASSYGKVKLTLKNNKYFAESKYPDLLHTLLKDPEIRAARAALLSSDDVSRDKQIHEKTPTDSDSGQSNPNQEKAVEDNEYIRSFQIPASQVENVKKRCNALDYPMFEEYDFDYDLINPNFNFNLKPFTEIRPYQEKSLNKMFGYRGARSGIIVLPTGAGKTLVGIAATCRIKKSTLVLCTSSESVQQWKQKFLTWSRIEESQIAVFTSESKEVFQEDAGIVISTFSMVTNSGEISDHSQKMMNFLTEREWGLLILDEVHVVPADMFRRVVTTIAAHAKLGLAATLIREDDKIDDLNYLIGPLLYEDNRIDLSRKDHFARVQCTEARCHMTSTFFKQYIIVPNNIMPLTYIMNPNKFVTCEFLIKYHEGRGDKIIVFCDNVFSLKSYAHRFKKPYIYRFTAPLEKIKILQQFQYNPDVSTIFLSKVDDASIESLGATVLIQISSRYGSRSYEAHQLGRILSSKSRNKAGFKTFYYNLISSSTDDETYSSKRQQFLIDQGHTYRIISEPKGMKDYPDLVYRDEKSRMDLFNEVIMVEEWNSDLRNEVALRQKVKLKSIPGDDKVAYTKYNKLVNFMKQERNY